MNINLTPMTNDATAEGQQRLLAALAANRRRQMMAREGGGGGERRAATPAFAPQNGGQMAAGLGMIAATSLMEGISKKRAEEQAGKQAVAGGKAMVEAVRALGGPFANVNDSALLGAFVQNPELASNVMKMAVEHKLKSANQERFEPAKLPDGRDGQRSTVTGKIEAFPEGRGPMAVAPGTALFDTRTNQPIYTAPAKPEAPTTRTIKQADGSEVAVQWDPKIQSWSPLSAPEGGNAVGVKSANPYALPGKPTEEQGKAAGFATRMVQGHNIINQLEAAAVDNWEAIKARIPGGANFIISEQKQLLEQGKRNYINSILRRESGAVISPEEFANADKQYFPQPGDSPAVVAQKRANREVSIEGVMGSAGPGFKVPEDYKPSRQQEQEAQRQQSQQAPGNLQPAAPQIPAQQAPQPQQMPMQAQPQQGAEQQAPAPNFSFDDINAEIERRQRMMMQQQQNQMPVMP